MKIIIEASDLKVGDVIVRQSRHGEHRLTVDNVKVEGLMVTAAGHGYLTRAGQLVTADQTPRSQAFGLVEKVSVLR